MRHAVVQFPKCPKCVKSLSKRSRGKQANFPKNPCTCLRNKLEEVERKCRDVLAWRCQLGVVWRIPGETCPRRARVARRESFLAILQAALVSATDAMAAAASSAAATASSAAPPGLSGRDAALAFLRDAAAGGKPGERFVSQLLHAHRAEVANRFPATFLSNTQRTAARRGRTRNQKPGARTSPGVPEETTEVSAPHYVNTL